MEETDKLEELMEMVAKIKMGADYAYLTARHAVSSAEGACYRAKDVAELAMEAAKIVSRLQDERAREERDGSVQ